MSKSQLKLENVKQSFLQTLESKNQAISEKEQERENFITEFAQNHAFFKQGEQIALSRFGEDPVPRIVSKVEFINTLSGNFDFLFTFEDESVVLQTELESEDYTW